MKKIKILSLITVAVILLVVCLSFIGGGMTTLTHEITINASKERVFEVLSDLEQVQHYNPNVVSAQYISKTHNGLGSVRECNLGKDGVVREKVTEVIDNQSISMELYEHNWPLEFMNWTTQVKTVGDSTLVSQTTHYKLKFGIMGSVLDKVILRNKFDKTLRLVFSSMKDYIEG